MPRLRRHGRVETLAALEERARAATPGAWFAGEPISEGQGMISGWTKGGAVPDPDPAEREPITRWLAMRPEDAAHIAGAGPEAVLALLAEIRLLAERGAEKVLCNCAMFGGEHGGTCLLRAGRPLGRP